jgi:hypothetical protein
MGNEHQSERDRIRAWVSGAEKAAEYIAAEKAHRLATESPAESVKVLLDLFAFYHESGLAQSYASGDNLEMKIEIGRQMAKLPRAKD